MNARFLKRVTLAFVAAVFAFSGVANATPTPPAESEAQLLDIIRQHPSLVKYIIDHPELRKVELQKALNRQDVSSPRGYSADVNVRRSAHLLVVHDPTVCDGFAMTAKNDGGTALEKFIVSIGYDGYAAGIHNVEVAGLEPNESKRINDANPPVYKTYVIFDKADPSKEFSRGTYRSCLR